jgi:hypothetical protein
MSRINLPKPDKFYLLFVFVMIVVSSFVIYVFKVIFESITTSADIGTQFTEVELKIDREKLDRAVKIATDKKVVELEIK